MNGVLSLAPGSVGPAIANKMIENQDLLRLSEQVIKPFYLRKSQHAVELLQTAITDERFRIHKPEGAMFLWLWFNELPITTMELYRRLKARGVLIVPGEYFFIGLEDDWSHGHECLRMNMFRVMRTCNEALLSSPRKLPKPIRESNSFPL